MAILPSVTRTTSTSTGRFLQVRFMIITLTTRLPALWRQSPCSGDTLWGLRRRGWPGTSWGGCWWGTPPRGWAAWRDPLWTWPSTSSTRHLTGMRSVWSFILEFKIERQTLKKMFPPLHTSSFYVSEYFIGAGEKAGPTPEANNPRWGRHLELYRLYRRGRRGRGQGGRVSENVDDIQWVLRNINSHYWLG